MSLKLPPLSGLPKTGCLTRKRAGALLLSLLCFNWFAPGTVPAVVGQENELKAPVEFCPGLVLATSFEDAQKLALAENRLILLIPSAHKLNLAEGKFGPSLETFRADSLADSRVVKLIKRRFVPFLFDLDSNGAHYDEQASKIMMDAMPELKGAMALPTPPMLVMNSRGKEKGRVNIFLSTSEMLAALAAVAEPESEAGELTPDETRLSAVEKANVYYELRKPQKALDLIKDDSTAEANLLKGKIACEAGDWPAMKEAFGKIPDDRFAAEIEICEIYRSWEIGNFVGITNRVQELLEQPQPERFPYLAEAMWYSALASYHAKTSDEPAALEMWEKIVRKFPGTLWGMRADRTRGLVKHGLNKPQMLNRHPESLLGKKYLSPFGVHELKSRADNLLDR